MVRTFVVAVSVVAVSVVVELHVWVVGVREVSVLGAVTRMRRLVCGLRRSEALSLQLSLHCHALCVIARSVVVVL
jgi:hypothetical protein